MQQVIRRSTLPVGKEDLLPVIADLRIPYSAARIIEQHRHPPGAEVQAAKPATLTVGLLFRIESEVPEISIEVPVLARFPDGEDDFLDPCLE